MTKPFKAAIVVLALLASGLATRAWSDQAADREAMVATIVDYTKYIEDIVGSEGISPEVLGVMSATERHLFVPPDGQSLAYEDRPVKIGYGQTISQPFIVALMTHLLEP